MFNRRRWNRDVIIFLSIVGIVVIFTVSQIVRQIQVSNNCLDFKAVTSHSLYSPKNPIDGANVSQIQLLGSVEGNGKQPRKSLEFSANGSTLIADGNTLKSEITQTACPHITIWIWNMADKYLSNTELSVLSIPIFSYTDTTTVVSPDGMLVSNQSDAGTGLWRLNNNSAPDLVGTSRYVKSQAIAFSPNNLTLAFAKGSEIELRSTQNYDLLGILSGVGYISNLAFDPSMESVLGSANFGATVLLWDTTTKRISMTLKTDTTIIDSGNIQSMVFNPTGDILATGSFDGVRIWDVITGKNYRLIRGGVDQLVFSPNSMIIATKGDTFVQWWNVESGKIIALIARTDTKLNGISFNSSGDILALGWDDGMIWLLDTKTHKILKSWNSQVESISAIRFSPDSFFLAVADGIFGTIQLWGIPDIQS